MALEKVTYADLGGANCALLDTTTVLLLCDPRLAWFLTDTASRSLMTQPVPEHLISQSRNLNRVLDVLARMTAYEYLVVDGSVLDLAFSRQGISYATPLGADFLRRTHVPAEVYDLAARNVLAAADLIHFNPASNHWLQDDSFVDLIEKRHVDDRFADLRQLRWLRDSDQSAGRALLYTEVARYARVPLFISQEKEEKLEIIGRRFLRDALRIVQTQVDRAVLDSIYAAVKESYGTALRFEWPPLVRYILGIAHRHEISIFEAVLRVRNLPAAVEFRRWLGELQRLLLSDTSASALMKANAMLSTITAVADQWGKECSSAYGVRYHHARVSLEAIPGVGTVLKAAGRANLTVKDPILNPGADYLAFVSEWYASVPEPRDAG